MSTTPLTTDPCPPTPPELPDAVDSAAESNSAALAAKQQWDRAQPSRTDYRRVVAQYERKLAESLGDRVRLQSEMQAFGAYLRASGVIPEHIVLCVHEAMKNLPAATDLFAPEGLGHEIVKWTIEGYYGPSA